MLLPEHLRILQETPLFLSVRADQYEILLNEFDYKLKYYQSGEEIAHNFTDIGILLSGSVHILKESIDNSFSIVEKVELGGIFGEVLTCLNTNDSPYKIVAKNESQVILIPYANLLTPTDNPNHFVMLSNLMRVLARRNLLTERKLEVLSKRTLTDKILAFLAIQREITGNDTFIIPYSRVELSEYLCVDRSALSRELANLMRAGLIKYKKNLFTIMTSYEDIDMDMDDDIYDDMDDEDDDDILDFSKEISTPAKNLDDLDDIDIDNISIEDILDEELRLVDSLDDDDLDNISIDDILNDDIVIKKPKPKPKVEEIISTQTSTEIDELIEELESNKFFGEESNTAIETQTQYNDYHEYEEEEYEELEESAMDDSLQEEQARVFSKFVQKAKVIATQANTPPQDDTQESYPQEEYPQESYPQEGYPQESYPQEGYPQEGYPQEGYPQEGYPQEGYPQESYPQEGYAQEGYPQEGYPQEGYAQEGYPQEGYAQEGYPQEGYPQEVAQEVYQQELSNNFQEITPASYQQLEYIPQPESEPAPIPQQEYIPQPEPEPAPIPQQEYIPQPQHEPAPIPQQEYIPQPEPEPAPIPQQEYIPQPQHEPAPIPQQEYIPQPEPEPAPRPRQEYVPQPKPKNREPALDEAFAEQLMDELFPTVGGKEPTKVEDDRDANLLLEPIDTMVDKITDELAPKSIEEAIQKLKDEVLPQFTSNSTTGGQVNKDAVKEVPKIQQQEIEHIEHDDVQDERTTEDIVNEIGETLSKSKQKKQTKAKGFNLFNKFKRD